MNEDRLKQISASGPYAYLWEDVEELVAEVRRLRDGLKAMKDDEFARSFNVDGPTSYIVETETIDALLGEGDA